jgi:hypothetical protein
MAKKKTKKKKKQERPDFETGAQVHVTREYQQDNLGRAVKAREIERTRWLAMLRDPTISLAVSIVKAMMMKQPWAFEGEDEEACEKYKKSVLPFKERIVESALMGILRGGWKSIEVAFKIEESISVLAGVKPLRNSCTDTMVYLDSGEFAGVRNRADSGTEVEIDNEHVIYVTVSEDTDEPADPLMRVAEGPFVKWEAADVGAQRYDDKCAGGFVHVRVPVGQTPYAARGGAETDNSIIALDMVKSLKGGGYAITPIKCDPETGEPVSEKAWSVEHVSAGGGLQPGFVVRQKYMDALKLRAFGIPERSTTEGTFGTKAEAEQHADIAVIVNTARHERIIKAVNEGPIKAMNRANYGKEEAVVLTLGKLEPEDRELFVGIFKSLMADPVFGDDIAARVNVEAMLDKLRIPTRTPEEAEALLEEKKAEQPDNEEDPADDGG